MEPAAYVFDFGPQGFMIGLMTKLAHGKVARLTGTSGLHVAILPRAILCGAMGSVAGMAGSAMLLWKTGATQLGWLPAMLAKMAFGAELALTVTPACLRAEMTKR